MEQGAVNPPLRRQSQCRKSKAALIYRTEFFVLGLFRPEHNRHCLELHFRIDH